MDGFVAWMWLMMGENLHGCSLGGTLWMGEVFVWLCRLWGTLWMWVMEELFGWLCSLVDKLWMCLRGMVQMVK